MTVFLAVIELVAFPFENVHFDEDALVHWAVLHDLTRVTQPDSIPIKRSKLDTRRGKLFSRGDRGVARTAQ